MCQCAAPGHLLKSIFVSMHGHVFTHFLKENISIHGHARTHTIKPCGKNRGPSYQYNQRELESAEKTYMYCFYLQSLYLESKKLA